MLKRIIGLVLTLGILGTAGSVAAQEEELQRLVNESQQQQDDLEQIPGGDLPGLGQDLVSGKIRLPTGEEVEKLRISQDREIDPDTYIVGPGDVMQLYVWGEFDLSYMLQVDPEGHVIIPTVGAFDVSGMTLTEAKALALDAALDKYPGVDVTINLASMRFFTAYVTGAVLKEGSFTIHPTTRVSDLIELAGGYTDELRGTSFQDDVGGQKVTRVRQIVNQATSRRSIQLIHDDNTVEVVDLSMFLATGNVELNPYVRMGDVVKVTFRDKTMFLFGAVNSPGRHEFRPGDTIEDLVNLAQGLRRDAPLIRAELWRRKGCSNQDAQQGRSGIGTFAVIEASDGAGRFGQRGQGLSQDQGPRAEGACIGRFRTTIHRKRRGSEYLSRKRRRNLYPDEAAHHQCQWTDAETRFDRL